MLKKVLIGVSAALLLPALFFGRDAASYVRTAGKSVREAVKSEVPPEFEIQRIKEIVDNLTPEVRECMHAIAEQQVDIEHLNEQIAKGEISLADQEKMLITMTNDVDSGKSEIRYASHTYTRQEVQRDLSERFTKFKIAKEQLERDRKIARAYDKALSANQKKLDEMLSQKQELEVQLVELEARLQSLRAQSTVSELSFDDSKLSQAKQAIRDLNKTLDVQERMMDVESKFVELIPADDVKSVSKDLPAEIRAYLGREKAKENHNSETSVALGAIEE